MVTPPREPGSIRRTSTIDTARRAGEATGLARARDLYTGLDGSVQEITTADVRHRMDDATRRVLEISVEPEIDGVDELVGITLGSRFRATVHDLLALGPLAHHPVFLLLDDLPAARFVSVYAIARGGGDVHFHQPEQVEMRADLCAGWARDSSGFIGLEKRGFSVVPVGPDAEPLTRDDDPHAWHDLPLLVPGAMRRSRRIDVLARGEGVCDVDVYFRDGYGEDDGREIGLHEYWLAATVTDGVVTSVDVKAGILPHTECPRAVDSAQRVVGHEVSQLRWWVPSEMTGPTTCTHLNDVLRSLSDVDDLAGRLAAT